MMRRFLAIVFALVMSCLFLGNASATVPPITKLLVVVEENHGLSQMLAGMPNLAALSRQYGYATNYHAITHPSEPNYLAIGFASTMGDTSDHNTALAIHGQTNFGEAISVGRTAKVYAESMPGNCYTTGLGGYAVKHNPWPFAVDERASCLANDVPLGTLGSGALVSDVNNSRLPNVGLVVPNLCNDAHDCSLGTADTWLKGWLNAIMAGPDYRSGKLAVVVTADEDSGTSTNTVLTTVINPQLNGAHKVVTSYLNHYSLAQLYEWIGRMTCLRNACFVGNMKAAFGLV